MTVDSKCIFFFVIKLELAKFSIPCMQPKHNRRTRRLPIANEEPFLKENMNQGMEFETFMGVLKDSLKVVNNFSEFLGDVSGSQVM